MPQNINENSRVPGVKDSSEMLKNYKKLKVEQKSYALCLRVYQITATFPKQEQYGIRSQIRRSKAMGGKPPQIIFGCFSSLMARYLLELSVNQKRKKAEPINLVTLKGESAYN
jgi:23S rRNA-intervening sequence protein